MRKLLLTAALAVLAWAAVIVPLPLLVLAPVPAQPVTEVMQLARTPDPISGTLLYTAVQVAPTTASGAAQAWLDEHEEIIVRTRLVPRGVDPDRFARMQQQVFDESVRVAAAVGMRQAGLDVQVDGGGAEVVQVVPGSPAAGQLQQGDVIVSANGRTIGLASELANLASGLQTGAEIQLTVRRGRQEQQVTLTVQQLEQTGQPGIGVLVRTVDLEIQLPIDVQVPESVQVGGPSAGLMTALTVYDLVEPSDLTRGRTIAGTGTIDLSGRVGPISGIPEKVRGAVLSGAETFLVPAEQAQTARRAAPEGLRVIAVSTLQDAIDALSAGRPAG